MAALPGAGSTPAGTGAPAAPAALQWPFLSHTFPLLLADQLASSPSTVALTEPAVPAALPHPLAALKYLSPAAEKRVRGVYISLLITAGRLLELPNLTTATACVYWHRFYSLHSLLAYHPTLCAAAAIFLASKVEENSRRVRDIINVVYRVEFMTHAAASGAAGVGASPARTPTHTAAGAPPAPPSTEPLQVSQLFWDLKEEVLRFEQKLLRVLAFEMKIYHPHLYVLHFAREIECSEEVARCAYYLANDTIKSTLCLQYAPNAIACACLYLASEMMAEQIRFHPAIVKENKPQHSAASASPYRPSHTASIVGSTTVALSALVSTSHSSEWWEYFGRVNQLEIEDITHQILDQLEDDADEQMVAEDPNGSLHGELMRIAEEEAYAQRVTAAGGSARFQTTTDDAHMEDAQRSPAPSMPPPPHTPTTTNRGSASRVVDRRPTSASQLPSAPSDFSSSVAPQRLQLHAYAPQARPFQPPSTAPTTLGAASYAQAYANNAVANPLPPSIPIMSQR